MAKKMSYTDPNTGAVYPNSTWVPFGIYIDFSGPSVRVDFIGYVSQTVAADVLKSALGDQNAEKKGMIASKSYVFTPDEARAFAASAPVGATLLDCFSAKAYEIAASRLDVDDPTPENPNRKRSFFGNAADVDLRGP